MTPASRTVALAALLAAAACARPEVVVETGTPNLVVRLLPYDRNAILDSLRAVAPPEPRPSPALGERIRALEAAEAEWRRAESEWIALQDSVSAATARLRHARRQADADLVLRAAADRLGSLDARRREVKRARDRSFARFERLRGRDERGLDSLRLAHDAWTDAVHAPLPDRVRARLRSTRRAELTDTTGTDGLAVFRPRPGRWWVHARHTRTGRELQWNVPVEVGREEVRVRLRVRGKEVRGNR